MLSCREGCTLVPPPHRAYKTQWQARTRRWPLPRLVCSSENMCTAPSCPPPVPRFFLALPKCRTRGHEIDRFRIFIWEAFLAIPLRPAVCITRIPETYQYRPASGSPEAGVAGRYAGEMFERARYDSAPMGTVLTSEVAQYARTGMSQAVEVSVVIPCLNEANSLAYCVDKAMKAFQAAGLCGEVVVADNGSTDGSIRIAEEHGARVIRVAERGYGAALRAGIAGASGPFIIMGDADDSYDFTDVPRFVEKLREGHDIVMGNRFRGEIKPGAMPPLHKYFGNPGLTALLNTLFHAHIGDGYCGMRGFTRKLYDRLDLRSTGMEFALEMIIKSAQIGARIAEIPIILWPDKRGRAPHLRSFRDGWRSLRFMLLYAPNWLFLLPGAALVLAGLFLVFWLLPGPRQISPHVALDLHTMIFGVIFTLLGAQILSIGAFAKVFSYA